MGSDKLPLSVLLALGLSSCGTCRPDGGAGQPEVCLSIAPTHEGPCLSPEPPPEPPPPEEPPDAPPEVCLSIAVPPDEAPPIPEVEPGEPETEPDDPPRPCLSVRWEPPPPPPEDPEDPETLPVCLSEDLEPEDEGDGSSSVEPAPGHERQAVLERLEGVIPSDVRERLG